MYILYCGTKYLIYKIILFSSLEWSQKLCPLHPGRNPQATGLRVVVFSPHEPKAQVKVQVSFTDHTLSVVVRLFVRSSSSLKRLLLLQFSSDFYQNWYISSLGQCVSKSDRPTGAPGGALKRVMWVKFENATHLSNIKLKQNQFDI